jgi:hypothetical protein
MLATKYHVGHAFRRAGRVNEALVNSERAYDVLSRLPRSRRVPQSLGLAGGLTLTSVISAASAGDRSGVGELMARAAKLAEELGRDGNAYWFAFGPTNVQIHQVWVALELGDAREAVRVGEAIDPEAVPSGVIDRRSALLIDLARSYGQLKMDAAAVNMLIEAERLTWQNIQYNKFVRELVRNLLRREHRASTPQLRPLTKRIGLLD